MSLKQRLADDLKDAIRSRNEPRKAVIRIVIWAAKNAEVEKGKPLDDGEVLAIIAKEVRRHREHHLPQRAGVAERAGQCASS